MVTTAADLQKAFDDLMAEKVALEAEAKKRDEKVAAAMNLIDKAWEILQHLDD